MAANQGMLFSYGAQAVADGTKGLYVISSGTSSASTQTYTFSGGAVASSTSLTGGSTYQNGTIVGNSTTAFAAAGGNITYSNTYTWSGATVAAGPSIHGSGGFSSLGGIYMQAAGIATEGIMAMAYMGGATNQTNKITYSGATAASATTLSGASVFGGAAGSATVAFFALGNNANTCAYTYSGDTTASSNALSGTVSDGQGGGNTTVGIIALGSAGKITNQITWSGLTVATSTNLQTNTQYGGWAGNSTTGVSNDGSTHSTVWGYAGQTSAAGSAMSTGGNAGAASNGISGVTQ
jgi:hypothetical protein